MKRTGRFLAILLCLVMVLSITAFAAWDQYQKGGDHNGQITDVAPYTTLSGTLTSTHLTSLTLPMSGSGWSGVDTEPIMQTESDGVTYAYVMYNGRSGQGGTIAKIACDGASAGTVIWYKVVTTTAANQLSTPLLIGNTLYYVYNVETEKGSVSGGSNITQSKTVTITATLSDSNGSYRLYAPSTISSGASVTLKVQVTKPDGNSVYLDVDNNSDQEIGTSSTMYRTLTTDSTTSYLNKNYANVFAASGTYTIKFIYTRSSGTYSIGTCKLYQNTITLGKINDVTVSSNPQTSVVVTNLPGAGQMNTPITTDGTYIFFGTWLSATANGQFFQVKISNGTYKKYMPGNGYGFYWSGAYSDGTNAYFGGDGGKLYIRPVGTTFGSATGTTIDLTSYVSGAGNVRSTIVKYSDSLYFTSQGGYLWRYYLTASGSHSAGDLIYANIGGTSTSAPAISENGYIYIGCYGTVKGVRAIKLSDFSSNITNSADNKWKNIYEDYSTNLTGKVQSSVIVYSVTTYGSKVDYVFFTTNVSGGRGYCYSYVPGATSSNEMWDTGSGNFTLQGMAAWNGFLTFGNDANTFYIIH